MLSSPINVGIAPVEGTPVVCTRKHQLSDECGTIGYLLGRLFLLLGYWVGGLVPDEILIVLNLGSDEVD
jgi:hypothetical protein